MIINFLVKSLCEKESVFVNNLGLFRKEYEPAHIGEGIITPPGYKVVFDPDFDGNGFAFTMFVSQKGGMLITEATTQIDQWVKQLKTALDNNKSVSFENFGTFAKGSNDSISFLCDRIAELNVEYEGMEPVELVRKKTEKKEEMGEMGTQEESQDNTEENIEEVGIGNIQEKCEDGSESENESEEEVENNEENENTKKRSWIIWVIILLIIALLAAAYYFRGELKELYQKYFEQTEMVSEEPTDHETMPNYGIVDSTAITDSTTLAEDSIVESTNEEIPEQNISSSESEPKANPEVSQLPGGEKFFIDFEKGKHYVIVGSFRSEKEVRKHIKDRKLEQYNPKVVLQPNSKNMRICIGVFDTEAAADSYGRGTGLNYWILN